MGYFQDNDGPIQPSGKPLWHIHWWKKFNIGNNIYRSCRCGKKQRYDVFRNEWITTKG